MKPEAEARRILATTRSKAKMYEFNVPAADHIELQQSPDMLLPLAVGLLGDAAAATAEMSGAVQREEVPSKDVAFAAIYFDSCLQSRLEGFGDLEFSLLASAAHYIAGNPGSSKVLINQTEPPAFALGAGLALLAFQLLKGDYAQLPDGPHGGLPNAVVTALQQYLNGAGEYHPAIDAAAAIRAEAYRAGDGRELLYADVVAAIVRKKLATAAASILPGASGLPLETWLPFFGQNGFPRELWPSQQRICDAGVLRGKSALIQMPTSAGKTRATELIFRSGFLADRFSLAVMVCPFRALCHDVRGDMARAFAGEDVVINEATDSFQEDISIEQLLVQKTILIVTPEKLLYLLRRAPDLANNIGLIVYDEAHQFDSGARGVTYELLLTSLKLLLLPATQVILISAVIANASLIAKWLLGDPDRVVDGTGLLPTNRSVAFASWQRPLGQLQYVNPTDPEDLEFFVPRVIERTTLPKLPRERKDREFPISGDGPSVGLYLALKLVGNGSVALFCGRKVTAAGLCADAAALFHRTAQFPAPVVVSDADEVAKIAALF